jgi:hypothetical protein
MKKPWIFLLALAFAGAAQAQLYKWTDKDGKTRYGDTPPPGVKATVMGAPASGPGSGEASAATSGPASTDAKKGPMTPAEREQDYRKRQQDAKKDREKEEQDRKDKEAKQQDCVANKEYLMTLESGQRISRTKPTGERYYMEDDQRAQEIAKTKQALQNCAR